MAISFRVGRGFPFSYDDKGRQKTIIFQCRELQNLLLDLYNAITGSGTGVSLDDLIEDVDNLSALISSINASIVVLQAQDVTLQNEITGLRREISELRGNLADITDALSVVSDRAFQVD